MYGIDAVYLAFNCEPALLENAVEAMRSLNFMGFNVTIPHKQNVLKYLDFIDPEAKLIGAVNTVKIENGKLYGYNTDGSGFVGSLRHQNIAIKDKKVLVLGAGGSARSICTYLAVEGAKSISILNRTQHNAELLINHLIASKCDTKFDLSKPINIYYEKYDIIINTTSVGMWPDTNFTPLQGFPFCSTDIVVDIIYNPLETELLKNAAQMGAFTMNGLQMLAGQAVKAIEIFTRVAVEHDFAVNILFNS